MLATALVVLLAMPAPQELQETITVSRVLVDVRVTTFNGEPVTDLTAADFDVRVDGKRAIVESAEWIDDGVVESSRDGVVEPRVVESPRDGVVEGNTGDAPLRFEHSLPRPRGRLFVFFVQTDFARNTARVEGQMGFLPYARELIATFGPDDRAAVFSFDSHLKFRLDFSSDAAAIGQALENALFIDHPAPPPLVPSPSLASRLDRDEMRDAGSSEEALLLVANALRPIPGPKSLLLLGWGLGERTRGGVQMTRHWKNTRVALDAARVSIFALDTTNADFHDLELGLESVADQTGGFYAKTHIFPRIALGRLQRTLSGHYELELRIAEDPKPGSLVLRVRVKKRGARVLAPSSVLIRP